MQNIVRNLTRRVRPHGVLSVVLPSPVEKLLNAGRGEKALYIVPVGWKL